MRATVSKAMSNRISLPSRNSLLSVALFAAGALSVLGYGYITKQDARSATPSAAAHQRATAAPFGSTSAAAAATDAASASANSASSAADEASANSAVSANNETSAKTESAAPGEKAASAVTPEAVAGWVAQATGSDAARRSAAIDALANAPKADAVPALAQVLETANESERPQALRSLRTLAQRQGDEDDRIRSVVRKIVFHDGDENAVQTAQATLNDIEQDLAQASTPIRR